MKNKSGIMAIMVSLSIIPSVQAGTSWGELFGSGVKTFVRTIPYGMGAAYIAAPYLPSLANFWVAQRTWNKLNQVGRMVQDLDGKIGGLKDIANNTQETVNNIQSNLVTVNENISLLTDNVSIVRRDLTVFGRDIKEINDTMHDLSNGVQSVSEGLDKNTQVMKDNVKVIAGLTIGQARLLEQQEKFADQYANDMTIMHRSHDEIQKGINNTNKELQDKVVVLRNDVNTLSNEFGTLRTEVRNGFQATENNFAELKRLFVTSPSPQSVNGMSNGNSNHVTNQVVKRSNGVLQRNFGLASVLPNNESEQ